MEDKIQKNNSVTLSTIADRYTIDNSVVLRAKGDFKEVLNMPEPETIEMGLDAPKINFLKMAWGEGNIKAVLSVLATDTAKALGFKVEGNERIVGLFVSDLIDKSPYYSIEDFIYFFRLMRRRELVSKTFGKEDWQVFYEGLKRFEVIRSDAIDKQNKALEIDNLDISKLPDQFRIKMIEIMPEDVKDMVKNEDQYKKVKIEFLKSRAKK